MFSTVERRHSTVTAQPRQTVQSMFSPPRMIRSCTRKARSCARVKFGSIAKSCESKRNNLAREDATDQNPKNPTKRQLLYVSKGRRNRVVHGCLHTEPRGPLFLHPQHTVMSHLAQHSHLRAPSQQHNAHHNAHHAAHHIISPSTAQHSTAQHSKVTVTAQHSTCLHPVQDVDETGLHLANVAGVEVPRVVDVLGGLLGQVVIPLHHLRGSEGRPQGERKQVSQTVSSTRETVILVRNCKRCAPSSTGGGVSGGQSTLADGKGSNARQGS